MGATVSVVRPMQIGELEHVCNVEMNGDGDDDSS
jgi:hypothetical protein